MFGAMEDLQTLVNQQINLGKGYKHKVLSKGSKQTGKNQPEKTNLIREKVMLKQTKKSCS